MKFLNKNYFEKWHDVAHVVLRLAVGSAFFMHGYQKLTMMGVAGVSGFLSQLGFPLPELFAVLLIAGEILGGAALILGFWTHWAGKVTAFIALVALFTVHLSKGFFLPGYEYIMVLFAGSFSLMVNGAGKYSLDAKMKK